MIGGLLTVWCCSSTTYYWNYSRLCNHSIVLAGGRILHAPPPLALWHKHDITMTVNCTCVTVKMTPFYKTHGVILSNNAVFVLTVNMSSRHVNRVYDHSQLVITSCQLELHFCVSSSPLVFYKLTEVMNSIYMWIGKHDVELVKYFVLKASKQSSHNQSRH